MEIKAPEKIIEEVLDEYLPSENDELAMQIKERIEAEGWVFYLP